MKKNLQTEKYSDFVKNYNEKADEHIKAVNYLLKAAKNITEETLVEIIAEINNYFGNYFKEEEKCLRTLNYPDLEAHKKEHRLFFNKMSHFRGMLEEEGVDLPSEIHKFLGVWLKNHTLTSDKECAPFIRLRTFMKW